MSMFPGHSIIDGCCGSNGIGSEIFLNNEVTLKYKTILIM